MNVLITIIRLAGVGIVVLYYRYMMKLGTWQMDWWCITDWSLRTASRLRRGVNRMRVWLWSQIRYVPSMAVRGTWASLRDRFRAGEYGALGT